MYNLASNFAMIGLVCRLETYEKESEEFADVSTDAWFQAHYIGMRNGMLVALARLKGVATDLALCGKEYDSPFGPMKCKRYSYHTGYCFGR